MQGGGKADFLYLILSHYKTVHTVNMYDFDNVKNFNKDIKMK